jgi:putative ABC transport system ATP-binding protein
VIAPMAPVMSAPSAFQLSRSHVVSDHATVPVLELSGVRFSWSTDLAPLLDINSLRVEQGERISLRGPSGSGKSTLLNILTGVVTPQQGSVRILGRDLSTLRGAARDRFRADHIGYIFQMFNLVPYLTVIENVCLPCGFSKQRRERAMRNGSSVHVEAVRLLQHLDMGDASLLHRPVTKLSVGQQQRVAAARALIGAPEIVIADEPTSALDADRRVAFLELLFGNVNKSAPRSYSRPMMRRCRRSSTGR